MSNRLVIIPTYNEKENVEAIIRAVFSLEIIYSVLIVDDNSPDGTHDIVKGLQQEFADRLYLEIRQEKEGLGKAYIHGFKWALARNFDYICEMDADFSHNPKDLVRLYEACKAGADMAIGSRYVKGINVVNWPLKRVMLSIGASYYVKLITGMSIQDPTAGFVCYHRSVLEAINLDQVKFVGYAFQIEMKFKAYKKKFAIKEVSIVFKDREQGYSKMSSSIIKEGILGVIKLKINSIFNKKNF